LKKIRLRARLQKTWALGLKPALIAAALRGPKGPLFHGSALHGSARILEFFRSQCSDALYKSFSKLHHDPFA